jgi:crotonobetainyl-CoA:carnitine CoA-transferase CaiB-like acyl-CoA transferase
LLDMMGNPPWADDERFKDPVEIARHYADAADEHLIPWFAHRSCAEVFALARQRQFPMAPLSTMSDVLELDQFLGRGAFGPPVEIDGRPISTVRRPYHFSDTPLPDGSAWEGQPTPRSPGKVEWPERPAATVRERAATSGPIFAGLRVLDLAWVWSGPMVSAVLADLGADVIKVEHRGRLDNARLRARPLVNGVPLEGDPRELSLSFHQHNRGKRGFTLDIKDPRGAELFKELAQQSDIVIENLTPGVFDRAGVGYQDIASLNPRIIWLAASSAGQHGPLAGMRAYAPIMTAMAGLEALVGYEDDAVVGMLGCGLGDPNAGSHGLLAVLSALRARAQTGRGQYIDMSQIEAAAAVLVEPLVNAQFRGSQPEPWGFTHPSLAPHGHFCCKGDDLWVAIAAADDPMWKRLANVVGGALSEERWAQAGLETRQQHRRLIHAAIEDWARQRTRDDVIDSLRAADVAVAPVWGLGEAMEVFDGALAHVDHPVTGAERIAPVAWDLSETPARVARPAPMVGQHTEEILRDLLGYADAEVASLCRSPATA